MQPHRGPRAGGTTRLNDSRPSSVSLLMTAVRRTGALVAAAGVAATLVVLPAGPAGAHGATTRPVSRTAACAGGGGNADSAACRAARDANGRPFGRFDNLRVPGVDGRDRQVIPDGSLCSGGLPDFSGLDLARDDWPATRLAAGGTIDIRYAGTIPHRGTFRVYLTRQGYRPTRQLTWDDLGEPILRAQNPPLRDGAYRMRSKLPAGRTGRHVLYVVWQTSSTPDTYYSCSDLILTGAAAAAPKSTARTRPSATPKGKATPPVTSSPSPEAAAVAASRVGDESAIPPGWPVAGVTLLVLAGLAAGLAIARIRRGRKPQMIRGRHANR
jgi:predicted carbohydrate-binding protein with CBM5 and CBM33 domain